MTKATKFLFLRGSLIPKLFHLQKNLWIKIYVKLSQLFILIQLLILFFISGEEREVMRSSRYCVESNRRITVNDRGLLIYFLMLNIKKVNFSGPFLLGIFTCPNVLVCFQQR